jgi:hypothetical protein
MGLRTRPPGPKWYFECSFCHEEIEEKEAKKGNCPECRTFGSVRRKPMGKPGTHIPPGFAEGEMPPLEEDDEANS